MSSDNQAMLTNDRAMDMKDDEVKRLTDFFRNTDAPYNGSMASAAAAKLFEWSKFEGKEKYFETVQLVDSYFSQYR